MALGKAEGGLFGLLAHESANIFKSVSTALNGFGAGRIQGHCGVFFDQLTETHNRAQRLWTTSVEGGSSPIAARLTQYRSTIDPIAAGGKNWSAQASCSQAPAELASLDALCMATCSMRSLKTRTQRLSQRTQTWRPINSG